MAASIATTIATIQTLDPYNILKVVKVKASILPRNDILIWKYKECRPCFCFHTQEVESHMTWAQANAKTMGRQKHRHLTSSEAKLWDAYVFAQWTNKAITGFEMRLDQPEITSAKLTNGQHTELGRLCWARSLPHQPVAPDHHLLPLPSLTAHMASLQRAFTCFMSFCLCLELLLARQSIKQ